MTAFDDHISDLLGELSAAKDTLEHYNAKRKEFERRFDREFPEYGNVREKFWQWRDQVNILTGYIERARRSQIAREPQPAPVQEEVEAEPASSFQGTGRSNDGPLVAAIRRAKGWRVGIPLAPSYRHCPSAFAAQALKREIMNHVDYESQLAAGNVLSVSNDHHTRSTAVLTSAAAIFDIDADVVLREAYDVYFDITTYGRSGEHYKW